MNSVLSVIIPAHQDSPFLRPAIESTLVNAVPSTEIIVIDDSPSADLAKSLEGLPVTVLRHETARGTAAARNTGLSHASGCYVTFLDSDDILANHGLRWRIDWLEAHPHENVVCGTLGELLQENSSLGSYEAHTDLSKIPDRVSLNYLRSGGKFNCHVWLFMFRRSVFTKLGGFDESLSIAEDCDFICRLLEFQDIPFFRIPVVHYRIHSQNLSIRLENGRLRPTSLSVREVARVKMRHGIPLFSENG